MSTSITGKRLRVNYNKRLGIFSGVQPLGVVRRLRVGSETTSLREPGTGTRRLTIIKQSHTIPHADIDYDFQTGRFISGYCLAGIPQAESDLSGVDLRWFDGCSGYRSRGVWLVNTCRVSTRVDESVPVSVSLIGQRIGAGSGTLALLHVSESGIGKACWADTKVRMGAACGPSATEITNWTEWEFNINNNIATQQLGRDTFASEVYDQQMEYNGSISRSIRCGQGSKLSPVSGGTLERMEYIISGIDGQAWHYCFSSGLYTVSRTEVSDLGLFFETIEWEAGSCSGWAV